MTDFGYYEYGYSVAIDSQGRIVAGGDYRVARYNPDGTLDNSFDGDGRLHTSAYMRALSIDGEDRIVTAGSAYLARYLPDGSVDHDFSSGSYLYIPNRYFEQVAIDGVGRIVLAGSTAGGRVGRGFLHWPISDRRLVGHGQ